MGSENAGFDRKMVLFTVLSSGLVVLLVLSNVIGGKLFELNVAGIPLMVSVGLVPAPLLFIIGSLMMELYGARATKVATWTALGLCAFSFALFATVGQVPFAPLTRDASWSGVDAGSFERVFLSSQRLLIASLVAFAVGQMCNIALLHGLKNLTGGRYFGLRTSLATMGSQLLDTVAVELLAWYGLLSLRQIAGMVVLSFAMKLVLAVAVGPLSSAVHTVVLAWLSSAGRSANGAAVTSGAFPATAAISPAGR